MLARVREVIVPPAPEYEKKSSSLISLVSSNEVELSVVVSPDVTDEGCKVPKLTNDYVSVALDMACEKSALTENDDDECESLADSYRKSDVDGYRGVVFKHTEAKIRVDDGKNRRENRSRAPDVTRERETNSLFDWSRTREAVSTDRDVRDGERIDAESDGGRGNGDF